MNIKFLQNKSKVYLFRDLNSRRTLTILIHNGIVFALNK